MFVKLKSLSFQSGKTEDGQEFFFLLYILFMYTFDLFIIYLFIILFLQNSLTFYETVHLLNVR